MATVTVITPSVPRRARMLAEAIASVNAQTVPPYAHLIHVDYEMIGCWAVQNILLKAVTTPWFAILDDDDLFGPDHLETLLSHATGELAVVYSWCRVEGEQWNPNQLFDEEALYRNNYIPATALIRTEVARAVGGWKQREDNCEDWGMWLDILAAGGRFLCVPEITWTYRFHNDNSSRGGLRRPPEGE